MNLPTRQECEGWDQAQLALFMNKNRMPECAATIHRLKINGWKFLNLTENDFSKFSLIYQPQLQKMVQDIKKNDGSLLDKLRRLKNKPLPNLPTRDYSDDNRVDDQSSDTEYDNSTDGDQPDDGNYEPPPAHRQFTPTSVTSFPRGEYLDSFHKHPPRPPKTTPFRPAKAIKELPPEPVQSDKDEIYEDPDADGNYIVPESNPSPDIRELSGKQVKHREKPFVHKPNRLCPPPPAKQSQLFPPKPSPRLNARKSLVHDDKVPDDDVDEVHDQSRSPRDDFGSGPSARRPQPLPKETPAKPLLKPRPDLKPRELGSQTLPAHQHTDHSPPSKSTFPEMKRQKVPVRLFNSPKPLERESFSSENGSVFLDKDAEICDKPWYASVCDRKTADDVLLRSNQDGAFMVRKSSGQDTQQPYTLVVFCKGRVYNIPIRFVLSVQQYALGREKKGEEYFASVPHIIENHQQHPLVLVDAQSNSKDSIKLCHPMKL